MPIGESVWHQIQSLSEALDGNREISERVLDEFCGDLKSMPRGRRDEVRRQMILIVAGLARLEVRLVESDGPLDSAI